MKTYGCIGKKLTHSFSKEIHARLADYRYELIEHNYPHHGAVAFAHVGNTLYELFRYLGVTEIGFNRKAGDRYPTEKPF